MRPAEWSDYDFEQVGCQTLASASTTVRPMPRRRKAIPPAVVSTITLLLEQR
jgi:hypothetical protein